MNEQELARKLHEIQSLKRMAEEVAAEIESLSDEIKSVMVAENKTEMIVDCFKVRYTSVTTNRIDTAAIKRECPEDAERYTKVSESKRFTIT